jgi:hypothetical protein
MKPKPSYPIRPKRFGYAKIKIIQILGKQKTPPQYFGQKRSYIGIIEGIMTRTTIHQIRFTEYSAR